MNDPPTHPHDRPMGSPKLPKYHHGIFSSQSAARDDVTSTSLKENDDSASASLGSSKPLLRVDCQAFGNPISVCSNGSSSGPPPVTPSPAAGGWRHTGKGNGWRANAQPKERSLGSDSTRIGFDGTPKTPSLNLLKPTASSIGHRVAKVAHSSVLLQSSSKYSSPGNAIAAFGTKVSPNPNKDDGMMPPPASASTRQQKHPAMSPFRHSHSTGCADNDALNDGRFHLEIMKRMPMNSPFHEKATVLDPFRNIQDRNSSMDDEEMNQNHKNVTNSNLEGGKAVPIFDNKESTQPQSNNQLYSPMKQSSNDSPLPLEQSPFPTPLSSHRRSTWSPMGSEDHHLRQWNQYLDGTGGNACPATLRSHLFDPVASQLLVQEEETPFVSLSSMHDSILESDAEESSQAEGPCAMGSFMSMPDLSSLPLNGPAEDSISVNCARESPTSPMPLFRQVSGSLHDVARPIPRKL